MARALKSFPESEREFVIHRRLLRGDRKDGVKGLGYWAAMDALYRPAKRKGGP